MVLIVIPLRGRAHIGPRHLALAYAAPAPDINPPPATPAVPAAVSGRQDVQYLRAPLVLGGVSQSRAAGVPLQTRNAAPAAQATPGPQAPVDTPAAASATPGPQATPTATPVPTDVPQSPNAPVLTSPTPEPDRHDPLVAEARNAATADLSRPLYYDHVVQPGDTVSTIAARYGISTDTVLWNNPLITDRDALFIGQTLRLPATDGVLYNVHYGDTVADIAGTYSVESSSLLSLAANGLADANSIREGQTVLVVGGKPPPPPPPAVVATPSPAPEPEPQQAAPAAAPAAAPTAAPAPTQAPPQPRPAPTPPPAPASTWIWPAHAALTSYFSPAHPLGIDIGVQFGTPIIAARAGTVTFAGGDPCCSYGYYVDIDHGGGWMTRYGHFRSWPIVSPGQHVAQGQVIGYSGSTGYSTGPHLHFEIRLNGVVQNPLSFLPAGGN